MIVVLTYPVQLALILVSLELARRVVEALVAAEPLAALLWLAAVGGCGIAERETRRLRTWAAERERTG